MFLRIAAYGIGYRTEHLIEYIERRKIDAALVYCIETELTSGNSWKSLDVRSVREAVSSDFDYLVLCVAEKNIDGIKHHISELPNLYGGEEKILTMDEFYEAMGYKEDVKKRIEIEYPQAGVVNIGSSYGGYKIDETLLRPNPIVYSFGIGEDMTFDMEMIHKYGAKVYAFDPTPKSIEYIKKNNNEPDGFIHIPIAISRTDGIEEFYVPKNDEFVSGSTHKRDELKSTPIKVEAKRFGTIRDQLDYDYIDVLKMDIEGSEFEALPDIIETRGCIIAQMCIEFHDRFYWDGNRKLNEAIRLLHDNGYKTAASDPGHSTYTFIKTDS